MANLPERLIQLRKETGLNRTEFAQNLEIPQTTLRNYELGAREPGHSYVVRMAKMFDTSTDYILGLSDERSWAAKGGGANNAWSTPLVDAYAAARRPTREAACNVLQIGYVHPDEEPEPEKVPTTIFPSAAGIPVWIGSGDMEDKEYPPGVVPKGTSFAIPISGDSMEPTIPDGAYIFVKQQPDIRNNEIGVFMLYDEATCKRYYKDKNGVKLISDNPKYDPIIVPEDVEGFGLVGKVLGHWLPE